MSSGFIEKRDPNKHLAAIVNPDTARRLLGVLTGTSCHTHTEIFPKPILVGRTDIHELLRRMRTKIEQLGFSSDQVAMKTTISFVKQRAVELPDWNAFENFNWATAERTQSILMTWQFLYVPKGQTSGEMHTLRVRIAQSSDPYQFLRAVFSKDLDDIDRIEIESSPMVCTVTFVDGLLQRELIQIVADWHAMLRKPVPIFSWAQWAMRRASVIYALIDLSIEFVLPLAFIAGTYFYMDRKFETLNSEAVALWAVWIMCFWYVFRITSRASTWLARFARDQIARMNDLPVFELTNGDQNKQVEALARAQRSMIKFAINVMGVLAANIASSIFVAWAIGTSI